MKTTPFLATLALVATFVLSAQPSSAQNCSVYSIGLQGQVGDSYGGNAFSRNGVLIIYPGQLGGSGNAAEVWIQSGNPVTAPQAGSIFVSSNTALIGSLNSTLRNGQIPLASIQVQRTSQGLAFSMRVRDQFAITQGGMLNVVNLGSGIAADAKLVDNGVIDFVVNPQGQIAGTVVLSVRNWLTTPHQTSILYQATLNGMLAGQSGSCIATSR